MNISIKTIPHTKHRYETCGDYFEKRGKTFFEISKMIDWRYEILVLVHEIIEWILVKHRGIKIEDIDAFDIQYEKERDQGLHSEEDEPGDDPKSPYRKEHHFAEKIEKLLAKELGVAWKKYIDNVISL